MHINCSKKVNTTKAKRVADFFVKKYLARFEKVREEDISLWVKKDFSPLEDGGHDEFICKIAIKKQGKNFISEGKGSSLSDAIERPLAHVVRQLKRKNLDRKKARDIKWLHLNTAAA